MRAGPGSGGRRARISGESGTDLVPGVAYTASLPVGPAEGWINLGFALIPVALAVALARPRAGTMGEQPEPPGSVGRSS